VIEVKDEGLGLGPDELALLNSDEPFTQVGLGQMQGNGGTGLGLNIVRQIMKLHNASEFRLASEGVDKGTSFILEVRCALATDEDSVPEAQANVVGMRRSDHGIPLSPSTTVNLKKGETGSLQGTSSPSAPALERAPFPPGYKVLHVEDDQFVRMTLPLTTFDRLGIEFDQVEDGEIAVELYRAGKRWDAIVIDNQMPVMGGAATARELRRMGDTSLMIGMTGDPSGCADRNDFEASGIDLCLDKAQSGLEQLLRALEDHAHTLAEEGRGSASASVAPQPTPLGSLRNRVRALSGTVSSEIACSGAFSDTAV